MSTPTDDQQHRADVEPAEGSAPNTTSHSGTAAATPAASVDLASSSATTADTTTPDDTDAEVESHNINGSKTLRDDLLKTLESTTTPGTPILPPSRSPLTQEVLRELSRPASASGSSSLSTPIPGKSSPFGSDAASTHSSPTPQQAALLSAHTPVLSPAQRSAQAPDDDERIPPEVLARLNKNLAVQRQNEIEQFSNSPKRRSGSLSRSHHSSSSSTSSTPRTPHTGGSHTPSSRAPSTTRLPALDLPPSQSSEPDDNAEHIGTEAGKPTYLSDVTESQKQRAAQAAEKSVPPTSPLPEPAQVAEQPSHRFEIRDIDPTPSASPPVVALHSGVQTTPIDNETVQADEEDDWGTFAASVRSNSQRTTSHPFQDSEEATDATFASFAAPPESQQPADEDDWDAFGGDVTSNEQSAANTAAQPTATIDLQRLQAVVNELYPVDENQAVDDNQQSAATTTKVSASTAPTCDCPMSQKLPANIYSRYCTYCRKLRPVGENDSYIHRQISWDRSYFHQQLLKAFGLEGRKPAPPSASTLDEGKSSEEHKSASQ